MDISLIPSYKDKVLAFEQMLLQEQQVHGSRSRDCHYGRYKSTHCASCKYNVLSGSTRLVSSL